MKYDISAEMVADILKAMPEDRKVQLHKACYRNCLLTSTYGLEFFDITTYKEGWYVVLTGTRCEFRVWAGDNDGEFVFGRKPKESSLHKLYDDHGRTEWAVRNLEDYTIVG